MYKALYIISINISFLIFHKLADKLTLEDIEYNFLIRSPESWSSM